MIFCVSCLNLYNEGVTIAVTLIAHTLADNYIYEQGRLWPIPPRTIIFNILFMSAIAGFGHLLKMRYKKKSTDKDPVFRMILFGSTLYMIIRKQLINTQGWDGAFERNGPALGYLFWELTNSILLIFASGPFKLWLDIKRGSTSFKEIEADL